MAPLPEGAILPNRERVRLRVPHCRPGQAQPHSVANTGDQKRYGARIGHKTTRPLEFPLRVARHPTSRSPKPDRFCPALFLRLQRAKCRPRPSGQCRFSGFQSPFGAIDPASYAKRTPSSDARDRPNRRQCPSSEADTRVAHRLRKAKTLLPY